MTRTAVEPVVQNLDHCVGMLFINLRTFICTEAA